MIILGLTGSIGMGKTTAANAFRYLGVPVYDADLVVHSLMESDGAAVDEVLKVFPEVAEDGYVNREALGSIVFANTTKLQKLEKILHPYVKKKQYCFLATAALKHEPLVVLDVPLLFETGGEQFCDGVVVVSASALIQKKRVLERPGMNNKRFRIILERQHNNNQKCHSADFVVQTGLGRWYSLRKINKIVTMTKLWPQHIWSPSYKKLIYRS